MSSTAKRTNEIKSFGMKVTATEEDGTFEGYAAVFGNVDRGNDIIEPGAFTKTLQENPEVPILWSHDHTLPPIGVSTSMKQDEHGLHVTGRLFLEGARAREVHAAMKGGGLKGLSIGYRTIQRSFEKGVRHLKELKLSEFSPVVFPMNELAGVDAVKSYGLWGAAESGVGELLEMIACGTRFMVCEVSEGDAADASRMQGILGSLSKLLASEIAQVAAGEGQPESDQADAVSVAYDEMMSAPVRDAIKSLEALLEPPADREVTEGDDGAARIAGEPDVASTLQAFRDRVLRDAA
ncbi:HK97 family phage prohead protease [Paraconexibacter algicola]|uniref:HK97 family phage prohead protease n=1 Tax=Paraconexibacter algicola TaxID=2133960 RepID=A0A2T4UE06_9ACTN|nr:HK97 family phage prohead protease [Paraconexibacter algicola]PTL55744.1 HK97 family phage prohead protease [Paraconexibacter algicola]